MRRNERASADAEMPTRYALDEARFKGGRDHIFHQINTEEGKHEPPTDFA